ncbi:Ubiquitin carboxyl-terminal hydrolase [Actinidia chinensis var. chinensis]|uniref:Ubiquitin carboxyl-terminal hydrolase n=1 Tax=Actinidia chinensis var. chinensis TaxID=1590841 RepID=A0A2R6RIW6_ACTCC|nr:Ubiquitin carboxyl-terminal hydrolase [Actinidia chinensis var. chinensis]
MRRLSHLFDFNQGSMARKVLTQKRHGGGSDTPRNSLELPVETSQSYCAVGDDIPYSYEVRHEWSENTYPTAASMKKLINEEISKGPKTRRNAPSVVARLMGMDMLPLDTKIGARQAEKNCEKPGTNFQHKEQNKKGSGGRVHCDSNSSRQIESDSFQHNKDRDLNHQRGDMKSKKPKPREHPQEEELQKFKKEFEAWQAARFRECSKVAGAHIRRKHEAIENVTMEVKKWKKERFSFKEKVSNFKYSFTLRGRLFGRKIQSVKHPHNYEIDFMKDITSGPTVVTNFGERHENCTEVPPSPASVCSSVYEESWRAADHLSSTSTPDLSPLEDTTVPQVFREISSNLNELRKQLNKLGAGGPKEVVIEEQPLEAETELEDETEAYIRDLLVASGLYEGSSDKVLSRWDPFAKPISNQIFEEVEESYMKINKDNEGFRRDQGEKKLDHKLLLDLLNEALAIVLGSPMTMSRFRKKAIGPTPRPPQGRKLLDHVWEIVGEHLHPLNKIGYSLDCMVARDLGYTPWSGLMSDDIDALGKEMESQITGYLIDEILIDLKS